MNRYACLLIIIFICCFVLFDIFKLNNVSGNLDLFGRIIYLDAGHGGADPGAIYGNIYESNINLDITRKLRDGLSLRGATVYMTRDDDNDLSYPYANLRKKSDLINRAHMIDKSGADMFISIHLNSSSDNSWSGAQVFYDDINKKNKILADIIQQQFKKDLKTSKEIKEIRDLYMYKNTKTLGVLVEVGFISNPIERKKLLTSSYQDKIVKSLITSISNYFNGL